MKVKETQLNCQILCLQPVAEALAPVPAAPLGRRLKLIVRRRLTPTRERALKSQTNDLMNWFCELTGRAAKPSITPSSSLSVGLQAGDWVRVRSLAEIEATLNQWRQLRGCTFMPEMAEFCSTTQRVLKPMKRFVDERDFRVKKSNGIILLEGVMCKGTAEFGTCDRSCFVFWREEWLEKIDGQSA